MALVACRECGEQVSTAAAACPRCRCPGAGTEKSEHERRAKQAQQQVGSAEVTLAQELLARWDSLIDEARARLARQLIKRSAPGIAIEQLGRGELGCSLLAPKTRISC